MKDQETDGLIGNFDSSPNENSLVQSSQKLARVVAFAGPVQTRVYDLAYNEAEGENKRISPRACVASDLDATGEAGESAYQQLLDKQYQEEA